MSSLFLPSIFHHNSIKKGKSTPPQSLLSKRSTISSTSRLQYEESMTNDNVTPSPPSSLQRSNTLSKMKRFGSLLSRNKRTNSDMSVKRTRVDAIFPPNINTSLASSHGLSASSTHSITNNPSSSDDDEEALLTPNAFVSSSTAFTTTTSSPTSTYFDHKIEFMTTAVPPTAAIGQNIDTIMSVTPIEDHEQYPNQVPTEDAPKQVEDLKNNLEDSSLPVQQQYEPTHIKEEEQEKEEKEEVDPSSLSGVALVRYHLSMALKEVDIEIENELNTCRYEKIKSIYTLPTLSF